MSMTGVYNLAFRRSSVLLRRAMSTKHIDTKDLDARQAYQLLINTVVPRPIAWVSTVGADGVTNLAPYSFYTVASTSPPVVSVTHVNPRAGVEKDTLVNLRETKECQVNLVTEDLVEIMNASCGNYPRNVSEFEAVGIESTPGTKVNAPGVAKALVRMECTLREILPIGNSHVMYLDVVRFAVHDSVSREGGLTVDDTLFTAVGKMGGNGYSKTKDRLELVRPQI